MNPLLKQAIENDLPDVVEGLLAQHPRWVNQRDREDHSPLFLAVTTYNRSAGCIRALLDAGADVNTRLDSFTVLHWAMPNLGTGTTRYARDQRRFSRFWWEPGLI